MTTGAFPSPNFGERRGCDGPDLIVLHYTAMETVEAAKDRLCDPEWEVSAHFLISEQGETHELVAESNRAWHAGAGSWGACTDVNSHSIGIELANTGKTPFGAAQMNALEVLLDGINNRWAIPPERVIGHSDMAPARKGDPGARFDWRRLALSGYSVWPETWQGVKVCSGTFHQDAVRFGYPADCDVETLLTAFRLRFRPGAFGPLDASDMGMINDLAHRFPVDRDTHST